MSVQRNQFEQIFDDLVPTILVTFKLSISTLLLLVIVGTLIGLVMAKNTSRYKPILEAIISLPIVLPPTVLGFYLITALGPNSLLGRCWMSIFDYPPIFNFSGLLIGSFIYSFPFMVRPLQKRFEELGESPYDVAATLGASRLDAFFTVVLPQSKKAYLNGAILSFAHTMGAFGVVLMIGGNIPGETRVLSMALYESVESLEYTKAHILAGILISFSFLSIFGLTFSGRDNRARN